MSIKTAFGTIEDDFKDFGYGRIRIEADNEIVYHDPTGYETWDSIKEFERWATKMHKMCGSRFERVASK